MRIISNAYTASARSLTHHQYIYIYVDFGYFNPLADLVILFVIGVTTLNPETEKEHHGCMGRTVQIKKFQIITLLFPTISLWILKTRCSHLKQSSSELH
jgi:hypothetical protein